MCICVPFLMVRYTAFFMVVPASPWHALSIITVTVQGSPQDLSQVLYSVFLIKYRYAYCVTEVPLSSVTKVRLCCLTFTNIIKNCYLVLHNFLWNLNFESMKAVHHFIKGNMCITSNVKYIVARNCIYYDISISW